MQRNVESSRHATKNTDTTPITIQIVDRYSSVTIDFSRDSIQETSGDSERRKHRCTETLAPNPNVVVTNKRVEPSDGVLDNSTTDHINLPIDDNSILGPSDGE